MVRIFIDGREQYRRGLVSFSPLRCMAAATVMLLVVAAVRSCG
jgi:hypothetical protein